ncbi:MAG: arginine--tRNA ligase [Maioricimonas sp. JB045]
MNVLAELRRRLAVVLADFTENPADFASMVRPAQDPKFGDFQANCAMPLAKRHGTNPREVAAHIVDKLDLTDLCDPAEVAGPGFINLRLQDDWIVDRVEQAFRDERLGVAPAEQPRHVVVDFSSPNVAKPMHVGHLRSTVIGDALNRILRYLGHDVISDNHIGDWGTQFGMIIYGYKNFLDQQHYADDPVGELARLYRLVNQLSDYHAAVGKLPEQETLLAEKQARLDDLPDPAGDKKAKKAAKKLRNEVAELQDAIRSTKSKIAAVEDDADLKALADAHPQIARAARDETARLHAGDEENRRLWDQFLPQCLAALNRIYERLDIHFDKTLGESFYDPFLKDVVENLQQKEMAVESDGAQCVFIEGNDAPFIVQKADGAFTYATTDLATIRYRVEEFQADSILYVVDSRQSEHFKLLFETAAKWGYGNVELKHVSFGTVMGKDRKPDKTRSRDTVGLESLLDEAVAKARQIVDANDEAKKNGPELDDAARQAIAEIVGIGGIKYADLHHNRESDYVFDWDKMLAMTGDTAAYMQYAYARTRGILRKGGVTSEQLQQSDQKIVLTHPAERALALKICRFEEALASVVEEYRPNVLTQYLFELANDFSTFYDNCHVAKEADESLKASRLKLVDLTGRVIARGLNLLGIEVSEQM